MRNLISSTMSNAFGGPLRFSARPERAFYVLAFVCLMGISLWFYKERTIFTDIAFHLFYLLKDGEFAIQNNRYVALCTQSFVLFGRWVGLSLKSIMILYSAGFVLFYSSVFLFIRYVLAQPKIALAYLFSFFFIATETHFWIQSELPQGMAFLFLILAMASRPAPSRPWLYYAIALYALCIHTVLFAHPLLIIPFIYASLFFMLAGTHVHIFGASALFGLAIYGIKHWFFQLPEYDVSAIDRMDGWTDQLAFFLQTSSFQDFLRFCTTDYYLLPAVVLFLIAFYIRRRHFLKLGLLIGHLAAFIVLVHMAYPSNVEKFYIENLYLPLNIIVLLPLVFDVLPSRISLRLAVILGFLLIVRFGDICRSHHKYTARLAYLQQIYDDHTDRALTNKILLRENPEMRASLIMTWATPYEYWLLTTMDGGPTGSLLIDPDIDQYNWALSNSRGFITKWGVFDYSDLPASYFSFPDTVSTYRLAE